MIQGQPGQKVSGIPSQQISWIWWHISTIPAMQEAQVGLGHPQEKHETLSQKQPKQKDLVEWLKW
jgi:hypothetical protein